ncbi:MAG: lysylphosphatidylglycerol synthase transmembrane domain-containing protein [Nanoarchaeota archaeon]
MKIKYKIISALILLGVLFYILMKLDLDRFYGYLAGINVWYVVMSFFAFALYFLIWNYRWKLSLFKLCRTSSFRLLPILMAGVFVNHVTPGAGTGGEPVRVYYLAKFTKANRTNLFALTMLEKLFSTFVFGALVFFSVFYVAFFVDIDIILKSILLTIIVVAVIIFLFLIFFYRGGKFSFRKLFLFDRVLKLFYSSKIFTKFIRKYKTFDGFRNFINREIDNSKLFLKDLMKNKNFVVYSLLLTFILWFFNYAAVYYSFSALGFEIKIIELIVVYSISVFVADLSIFPGGIGLMEAVSIGLYNAFGIPLEIATLATLLNRVVYYLLALGVGYLCLTYLHFRYD